MIYLDNAATTRVAPEVLDAMLPYLRESYGNPGAVYSLGREAKAAVDRAREQVASFMGCSPENVIFTSGGSEGNNLVIRGLETELRKRGRMNVVISKIEHDSVVKAADALCIKDGFYLSKVRPTSAGEIETDAVVKAINQSTGLVSVMMANNETGVLNDTRDICFAVQESGALFHTDAVQAAGCVPLCADSDGYDFMTISSHKIHGPKGVGAIYASRPELLSPLICGGDEQEFGLRGGTENVAGIVGFGKACELTEEKLEANSSRMRIVREIFLKDLRVAFSSFCGDGEHFQINGGGKNTNKVLNLRFDGADAQSLLLMLDARGICVSAGSACRSHESRPSRVLTAMGLSGEEAHSSIRVSFSEDTSAEDVRNAAVTIAAGVDFLRKMH